MVATVSLDLLPLKRVLAIDETGLEHLPPERSSEEKSRLLLQRIDFEHSEEKDAKRTKSTKESVGQSKWPWQGLVESLQLAQQELSYILDFLTHVEANDAITVTNMMRPKQLLHETCSELALRASSKLHNFKKVGKYLKQTAKALEQQVEREAVFYGALMRLQQHWKVKRLRGVSAGGPGGNAGFTIDLSYPQMSAEMMWGLSVRSAGLYSINVAQDSEGLLIADLPNQCMNTLHMRLSGPHIPHCALKDEGSKESSFVLSSQDKKTDQITAKEIEPVGHGVKMGADLAHSILRRIQMAIVHEQIFEWTVRESLQSSSGLVVTGVEDRSLQISLGHSCVLILELHKSEDAVSANDHNLDSNSSKSDGYDNKNTKAETQTAEPSQESILPLRTNTKEAGDVSLQSQNMDGRFWKDMSTFICLQQAFYRSAFVHQQDAEFSANKPGQIKGTDGLSALNKPKDFGGIIWQDSIAVEAVGSLKNFSLTMRHRIFSSKVQLELEKLVLGVPYLFLSCHPTWSSRIALWELTLRIPKPITEGWRMSMVDWREAQRSSSNFLLRVILCDALLFVEGLEATDMEDGSDAAEWKRSKHKCNLTELPGLLLSQFASKLVKWLHEEAIVMGLDVRRDFLSLDFRMSNKDDFIVLASLDFQAYGINWWLHVRSMEGEEEDESREELHLSKNQARRFLGPLNLETLRSVLVDLLSHFGDES